MSFTSSDSENEYDSNYESSDEMDTSDQVIIFSLIYPDFQKTIYRGPEYEQNLKELCLAQLDYDLLRNLSLGRLPTVPWMQQRVFALLQQSHYAH